MPHDHDHSHGPMHVHGATHGPRLIISLAVTIGFVAFEGLAGWMSHSLALMSDAGHNASDALALGLAAYAIWIAKKPSDERKTYGYHRVAILTALFNAMSLILIAVVIFVEAGELFRKPQPVVPSLMIWVAAVSVVMNTLIAWALSGGAKESLNMKAAYIHMVGDAASAVAVIVAGIVVKMTGWVYADPLVSALIGVFIIYTAWGITKEAGNILLESAPKDLDVEKMVLAMEACPCVLHVHDVHVWTVSDGMHYLSCHVELPEETSMTEASQVVLGLNELLAHDFDIAHATIQTEVEGTCASEHNRPRFCDESNVRHGDG